MPNRHFLLIFIVLLVVGIGGTSYVLLNKEQHSETSSAISDSSYTGQERVFVADLREYTDLETKTSIERTLFENIDKDQPDLYTGTIRETSVSEETAPSGQKISSLFIDVTPIGATYKITLFSDPRGGRPSVNVECAPEEEQLDSAITCKDIHHHE